MHKRWMPMIWFCPYINYPKNMFLRNSLLILILTSWNLVLLMSYIRSSKIMWWIKTFGWWFFTQTWPRTWKWAWTWAWAWTAEWLSTFWWDLRTRRTPGGERLIVVIKGFGCAVWKDFVLKYIVDSAPLLQQRAVCSSSGKTSRKTVWQWTPSRTSDGFRRISQWRELPHAELTKNSNRQIKRSHTFKLPLATD